MNDREIQLLAQAIIRMLDRWAFLAELRERRRLARKAKRDRTGVAA